MSIVNSNRIFFNSKTYKYIFFSLLLLLFFLNSMLAMKETIEFRAVKNKQYRNAYSQLAQLGKILLYEKTNCSNLNAPEGNATTLLFFDKYNIKYEFVDETYYKKHVKDFKDMPTVYCYFTYYMSTKLQKQISSNASS